LSYDCCLNIVTYRYVDVSSCEESALHVFAKDSESLFATRQELERRYTEEKSRLTHEWDQERAQFKLESEQSALKHSCELTCVKAECDGKEHEFLERACELEHQFVALQAKFSNQTEQRSMNESISEKKVQELGRI
jgi:hypothetical protein